MMPWSAHALQEGRARDQPLFSGASHARMTLEWVPRRLVRFHIRRHGENKGAWRRDNERGGASTWRPLPGRSPVPEGISVESLSSLNLCGDPQGVQFGTTHFQVALQHWVTLGWCRQWRQGKGVHFAVQWTAVLAPPRPIYEPATKQQYEVDKHSSAMWAFCKQWAWGQHIKFVTDEGYAMVTETRDQVKNKPRMRVSAGGSKAGVGAKVALMYLLGKAKALGKETML